MGGVRFTSEHIEHIRAAAFRRWSNPEERQKQSERFKGRIVSREHRDKISRTLKGRHLSDFQRRKISEAMRGRPAPWMKRPRTDSEKRAIGEAHKGKKKLPESNLKNSETHKRLWQNKTYREKIIRSSLHGLLKRPTRLEQSFINIVKKHDLPYRYTGNGSFLIGFKNPDFVNTNGEKICVEVGNTYHHAPEYTSVRVAHFAKYGWLCVVFITNELNEQEVIRRLTHTGTLISPR